MYSTCIFCHSSARRQRSGRTFSGRATAGVRRATRPPVGRLPQVRAVEPHSHRRAMGSDRGVRAIVPLDPPARLDRQHRPRPDPRRPGARAHRRTAAARDGGVALRRPVRPPTAKAPHLHRRRRRRGGRTDRVRAGDSESSPEARGACGTSRRTANSAVRPPPRARSHHVARGRLRP